MKTTAVTCALSLSLALALALAGCSKQKAENQNPQEMPQGQAAQPMGQQAQPMGQQAQQAPSQVQPGQPHGAQPGQAPGATEATLTDAQILGVVRAINENEVEAAGYVVAHAPQVSVKQLATRLEHDHADALTEETHLATQLQMAPDMSSKPAKQLAEGQTSLMNELHSKTGDALGHAFVDQQVTGHTAAIEMVQTRLLPQAHAQPLHAHLESFLTTLKTHLDECRRVQQSLGQRAAR